MLQVFLYLNLFVAGIAAALAARFGYEHYITKKTLTTHVITPDTHTSALSDAARSKMMQDAQARFKAILENAAGDLQDDLQITSTGISTNLKSLGENIVEVEMKRYTQSLENLRTMTEESMGMAAAAVTKHQGELTAALQKRQKELEDALQVDITAEKERLVADLDKKLAGAVTAFLIEALGHNVDLGAQTAYLTETLAAHKDELIKELKDAA
ncbi:MAG: hypothetical protein JWO07_628 [Candidatus Saccharibacteria bacterium]|nr:hypothetical protein [Candidatus Saccharibacteria bacterium]